jgi:SPP1 family predicted phage head-tail adaptor
VSGRLYIRAGDFNRQVVLQRRTDSTDAVGQIVPTWVDVGTYWAAYEPGLGTERAAAGGTIATAAGVFRIRHESATPQERDRIAYNDAFYNIDYVENRLDADVEWWLHVSTGANQG